MRKLFLLLVFLLLISLFPNTAFAQTDWDIDTFNSDITVQNTGSVLIKEDITADFTGSAKHGIFRSIPFLYTKPDGSKIYTDLKVTSVLQDDQPAIYSTSYDGDFLTIKIGDPNVTHQGKMHYSITYTDTGVLQHPDGRARLQWNVTGNSWEVPINVSTATVRLATNQPAQNSCYIGTTGSKETCLPSLGTDVTQQFSASRVVEPGEGMTIDSVFANDTLPIPHPTMPNPWELFYITTPFIHINFVLFAFLPLLTTSLSIWLLWYKQGRDQWFAKPTMLAANQQSHTEPVFSHDTVVVEYEPPQNLRPAEVGAVMHEGATTVDITATIIDLANRGYLTIKEIPKKGLLASKDYLLQRLSQPDANLLGYESLLLQKLFGSNDSVTVSSLKNTFYKDLAIVKKEVMTELTAKGYFLQNPDSVKSKYSAIAIGMKILAVIIFFLSEHFQTIPDATYSINWFAAGLFISGLILLYFSRIMPARTAQGHELYRRCKGYFLFISKAETYRQRFFEKRDLFNSVLPYAIMFGLTEKFAKALSAMGIQPPAPVWYYGASGFNASSFGSDMSSFASNFSSVAASAPSSSGSGGSGGGFGGGGGGSW